MPLLPTTAATAQGARSPEDIRKKGLLTKLKKKKKRFFVLRDEVDKSNPARLEYFPDEAKFLSAPGKPKRIINLKDCLDIVDGNAATGKCQGFEVIIIYTKKDAFRIGCSSATEKREWLDLLLKLKAKSYHDDRTLAEQDKYEFSWEVRVMKKSSGSCHKIKPGKYRFCLTNRSVALVGEGGQSQSFEFALESIRKLGDTKDLFFMELGTSSSIGEGLLWMEVDDSFIASNIHMHVLGRMNDCGGGGRPRCQTVVGSGNRNSTSSKRSSKRSSIQSTSSTSTSSTATVVADVCGDFFIPSLSEGRTTSSSSVSSLRSSGSSLPSSVNNKSSMTSVLFSGRHVQQGTPSKEGHYFPMDGFRHQSDLDLDFGDLLRTSSVGNKSEYLRNVQPQQQQQQQQQQEQQQQHHHQPGDGNCGLYHGQSSKDAERCSSAPHLKNEGEIRQLQMAAAAGGGGALKMGVDLVPQEPPPYKEGCFYCEALNAHATDRKDIYAPLDFEKPGKGGRHSASGLCKRASCHIRSKVMTPKQPVGGKIFRTNPLSNYQHFLHHVVLDHGDQDHQGQLLRRERLPTIDGSMMMTSRSSQQQHQLHQQQPRPRALTGDQKNLSAAVHERCCREALENGYMRMHGFVAGRGGDRKKLESSSAAATACDARANPADDDDPYLDMTEGLRMSRIAPPPFSDYLDMNLCGPSPTDASKPDVAVAAAAAAATATAAADDYLDMSFGQARSSNSSISSTSSVSSATSQSHNPSGGAAAASVGNLSSPAAPSDYMTMSFSPLSRLS